MNKPGNSPKFLGTEVNWNQREFNPCFEWLWALVLSCHAPQLPHLRHRDAVPSLSLKATGRIKIHLCFGAPQRSLQRAFVCFTIASLYCYGLWPWTELNQRIIKQSTYISGACWTLVKESLKLQSLLVAAINPCGDWKPWSCWQGYKSCKWWMKGRLSALCWEAGTDKTWQQNKSGDRNSVCRMPRGREGRSGNRRCAEEQRAFRHWKGRLLLHWHEQAVVAQGNRKQA